MKYKIGDVVLHTVKYNTGNITIITESEIGMITGIKERDFGTTYYLNGKRLDKDQIEPIDSKQSERE